MKHLSGVQRAAKRTLIVTVIGIMWFFAAPWIFIWGLPQFGFYNTIISNIGTNNNDMFQFWVVLPEVALFLMGIFWAGGFMEWIAEHIN